jgi:DNA repair protein RadC
MSRNASPSLKPVKHKRIRIKDLPLQSRPREKLTLAGRENLTDEELIAILLGTGSSKQNALTLSTTLLKRVPLSKLSSIPASELIRFPGVGRAKASRIIAAFELGSRLYAPAALTKVLIRSTQDVVAQARDIAEKKQEYLVVFYLNARYELIQREIVGQGSLNHMMITAKEIFAPAVQTPCATIILCHNHPSGDPTPSEDDIAFTTRIHEAGDVMGIRLLDHVIIARSGYFSFRENKRGK